MEGQPQEPGRGGQPRDPSSLRVSDEDRHRVAEVLRHAAGEGRIDLDELDQRLEATYAAKTYGDLVPLTSDLPSVGASATASTPRPAPPASPVPAVRYSSSLSVMSECARRGVWEVPARHGAFSLMGSVVLDLREVQFEARETVIDAYAVMAGIDIVVNPWTQVAVEGLGVMGEFTEARPEVAAEVSSGSPVVRVRGLALMGGVRVRRQGMPSQPPRRIGRS